MTWTDQIPAAICWAILVYGVGACLLWLVVGAFLFLDQQYGYTAFREWIATRFWRSVLLWPVRFYLVIDLIGGMVFMPLVYKFQLWRSRPKRRYKTPYQER